MSEFISKRSVKKSRKERRCYWCGEKILIGKPAEVYFSTDDGNGVTARFHPECDRAIMSSDTDHDFWETFSRYTMKRGLTVEECDAIYTGVSQS